MLGTVLQDDIIQRIACKVHCGAWDENSRQHFRDGNSSSRMHHAVENARALYTLGTLLGLLSQDILLCSRCLTGPTLLNCFKILLPDPQAAGARSFAIISSNSQGLPQAFSKSLADQHLTPYVLVWSVIQLVSILLVKAPSDTYQN